MIERIEIGNVATYGSTTEVLNNLKKINFLYGSNGAGKTTISRVIADCDSYPSCSLTWQNGTPLESLVYNSDFVERNFNQSDELKGIFTLGEEDKEKIDKIGAVKAELHEINNKLTGLESTLRSGDGSTGKRVDLDELEALFRKKCWELKLQHDTKLKGAFEGLRNDKEKFKNRLLKESKSNASTSFSLSDLEKRAETVFCEAPQSAPILGVPDGVNLLAHEGSGILKKKVIGKADVDIAGLINKLGSSDWVKQGRAFFSSSERVCPFCQQNTPITLEESLNEYFDETFTADVAAIDKLLAEYQADSEELIQGVEILLDEPSSFLDAGKLQAASERLKAMIRQNIQRIEEKRRESSKPVELVSLAGIVSDVRNIVSTANNAVADHNAMVSNLASEKTELTGQVWRYLLDHDIKSDLDLYEKRKSSLQKAIDSLERQIVETRKNRSDKEQELRSLEKDSTSIQPTIDGINELLKKFGFTGFELAKSDREMFYKIQRPDGSDAKETLSEGERSFVTFLYFYHRLKGSESASGTTTDRVVVFDDPVSSLDSDILFIVSTLIKTVFDEVRSGGGVARQVFVLTHNVYFHKEVSFNRKRSADSHLKDETFWTVVKLNQNSKIRNHDANPIKTSYELLWTEVRNSDGDNLAIQNTLRRILESYFKILGNVDPDSICALFEGNEKLICHSLFSWVNDGSHSAYDSLYVSIDTSMVKRYLDVFRKIFEKTNHLEHYNMMMGVVGDP